MVPIILDSVTPLYGINSGLIQDCCAVTTSHFVLLLLLTCVLLLLLKAGGQKVSTHFHDIATPDPECGYSMQVASCIIVN